MPETVAEILKAYQTGDATPADIVARSFARLRAHDDPAMFISLREENDVLAEAQTLVESFEERSSCAELYWLRGVFLSRLGADQAEIEEAFCKAISTAKQQKSISLTARAEATYAEYRRQRVST